MSKKLLVLVLAVCFGVAPMNAQSIGDVHMDEANLYAMTKQMGQFIRRFNYEEDQFGNKINPKDPSYRSTEKRRQSLAILFDQQTYGSQPDLQRFFIEDVTANDSTFMTFLGGRWYSEVSASFKYKGKAVNIIMILGIEKEGLGSKWVLNNIYFSEFNKLFPTGEIAEKEKHFLHPMSHELDFMNIYKIFKEPEVIEYYASKRFEPDTKSNAATSSSNKSTPSSSTYSKSRTGTSRCRGSTAAEATPDGSSPTLSISLKKRKTT